jgi:hypothetical protein
MRADAQFRIVPGTGESILEALGFEGEYPTLS